MADGYELLQVNTQGRKTVAVLPLAGVRGEELRQSLRADFARLAETACEVVELDLRSVDFIDGLFFPRLLELRKSLQERSISLQLRVSPNLKAVIEVTKLDRLFEMKDDSNSVE